MKLLIYTIIFLLAKPIVYCGDDIPEEFKSLLERGKLTFEPPKDMKLLDLKKDPLMNYDITYYDEKNIFEIRINVVPLDSKDTTENLGILNLSEEGSLDAIDLKAEKFNADKAGAGEFTFKEVYDNNYEKGGILFLYKNKCAAVYIFYLGKDSNDFGKMVGENIFLIKFKN
ncbi:MAG TPA: hypothetical protein VGK25_11420 [Ignavibacteria bacterium]|jgi:hypothetical protein